MNKRANWLAWSLQFFVGFVVGSFIGLFFLTGGRHRLSIIANETSTIFILGAGLIGAALASYFGDRLWFRNSSCINLPEEPRHSRVSRWTSFTLGSIGGVLVIISLFRSWNFL